MENLVLKSELVDCKRVHGIISSYGSTGRESATRININQATVLDKAGIKFALTADDSCLCIYVSDSDFEKSKSLLNR